MKDENFTGKVELSKLLENPDSFLKGFSISPGHIMMYGENKNIKLYLDDKIIASNSSDDKVLTVRSFAYRMINQLFKSTNNPKSEYELAIMVNPNLEVRHGGYSGLMFRLSEDNLGKEIGIVKEITGITKGMSFQNDNVDISVFDNAKYILSKIDDYVIDISLALKKPQKEIRFDFEW